MEQATLCNNHSAKYETIIMSCFARDSAPHFGLLIVHGVRAGISLRHARLGQGQSGNRASSCGCGF